MPGDSHDAIINAWIDAANTHDLKAYLAFFTDEATLDDPGVGSFAGKDGIAQYYEEFFIGYNTKTRLVGTEPRDGYIHAEVDFTGDFPGGQTGGIFDLTFAGDKIATVKADLI